jgi:hypothetical protein
MTPPLFTSQYQQRPIPLEGNISKREWLRFFISQAALSGSPATTSSFFCRGNPRGGADDDQFWPEVAAGIPNRRLDGRRGVGREFRGSGMKTVGGNLAGPSLAQRIDAGSSSTSFRATVHTSIRSSAYGD